MNVRKELIEVGLPLAEINIASAREKYIRHGHSSTVHLWWTRRAVIFAQIVNDPSSHPDIFRTEKTQERNAERLFRYWCSTKLNPKVPTSVHLGRVDNDGTP